MPEEDKVWWRAEFYWTENNWPEDGYDPWPTYVDEWYFHEFRRFEYDNYGDDYDYDVMDYDGTYYTTLPSPHEDSGEERILWPNWFWDPLDNDEEVEVYTKEPCDLDTYTTYVVRVTFDKHSWYDDYMIVFESEHGNHIDSPPDDFSEIERKNYVVPGALSFGTRTGFESWSSDEPPSFRQPIDGAFQGESPVLDVKRTGGLYPYLTTVVQGNYSMKTIVSEYARIYSNSELERFVKDKNDDLNNLDSEQTEVEAIVSFNRLLEVDELVDLVEELKLDVSWLRYVSSKGGGKLSIHEKEDIQQKITLYDECFKEDYGEDFTFVDGVGAVRVRIPIDSVTNLMNDARVLVIDQGPMTVATEISNEYPDTIIVLKWFDIFQEYMKLNE
jgi:hypothetical protein